MYKHTQIGWLIRFSIMGVIIILLVINFIKFQWIIVLTLVMLIIMVILFSSLTVMVDNEFIKIKFGIGLIGKSFKLSDIKEIKQVRNRWWYGWGIRLIPGGWLFNVSGLDAVELTMKSGKIYRIGTDEPQKLKDAIEKVIR